MGMSGPSLLIEYYRLYCSTYVALFQISVMYIIKNATL